MFVCEKFLFHDGCKTCGFLFNRDNGDDGEMAKKDEHLRKPEWLKIKLNTNENYTGLKKLMRENNLHTVCEEAKCYAFRFLQIQLSRQSRFYSAETACSRTDGTENHERRRTSDSPAFMERVADSVALMNLKHAVITAVARDDQKDGGAGVFAETVRAGMLSYRRNRES
jgi:lipoic acid synthetase